MLGSGATDTSAGRGPADGGAGIRISGLLRRFGPVEAVRGISLEIREGETFGLLGPNGAGKTTTLSMLSTLLPPTEGDAEILGASLSRDVARVKRLVGLAPQQISLYPELTGEENLHFFGRIHGVGLREVRERAAELLALVGLEPRRRDRVRTYSGGMQRRLNLACSLVHRPRVLLLDEPTLGVDPQSRDKILAFIQGIAGSGNTVVYTTHYMEEAERLCDRIAIMDEGRIAAVGTLEELLEIVGMGEVVEIESDAPLPDPERLRAIPGFVKLETDGRRRRIRVTSAARALGPIGKLLAEQGGAVDSLQVYPVNLERVFMHLTGHALRD